MGAWIETLHHAAVELRRCVAPYMGAWIETYEDSRVLMSLVRSLPTWGRGLKLK